MVYFGAAHGWGRAKRPLLVKICYTYPTLMKLGTVVTYLKKIKTKSRDTPFSCADINIFSLEISKFSDT